MTESAKVPLGEITTPSTAITPDVVMVDEGSSFLLYFEFYRDGVRYRSGVRFNKIRAIRWRAEGHCTLWHTKGVYDTIAEVEDSQWVEELRRPKSAQKWNWIIRHFMVYFDSFGCFEAAAESWELLPDELVE